MIQLYDNPFSPFARKVRMVLDYKALDYVSIDALAHAHHADLLEINPRGEVPVLVDGEVVVVNSSDIVAYLEHAYPDPAAWPADPKTRVCARALERLADSTLDAIIHDVSIWVWPTHKRQDHPPEELVEAARRDAKVILDRLERDFGDGEFFCGAISVADFAVFPQLSSLRLLGMGVVAAEQPRLAAWEQAMRAVPAVRRDLDHVKRMAAEKFAGESSPYEGEKIVWRGDRIEWLFRHGFVDWWVTEYREGRAVLPGIA